MITSSVFVTFPRQEGGNQGAISDTSIGSILALLKTKASSILESTSPHHLSMFTDPEMSLFAILPN